MLVSGHGDETHAAPVTHPVHRNVHRSVHQTSTRGSTFKVSPELAQVLSFLGVRVLV